MTGNTVAVVTLPANALLDASGVFEEESRPRSRAGPIIPALALTLGTRLGVYEIIAQIGEGGMGQVFHARDTKLDRDVAIKILPEAFAHDADRLARFTREAKTLASLNHPNIAGIYGLEESGGVSALVMELVEGRICRNGSREARFR